MSWFSNLFNGKKIKVTRTKDGTWSYFQDKDSFEHYSGHYLDLSYKNIALFTALDLRSTIFSTGKPILKNADGDVIESHPLLDLFKNPNYAQSQQDYLYSHLWFKSLGNNIARVIPKRPKGKSNDLQNAHGIENLIPSCIDYREVNKVQDFVFAPSQKEEVENQEIKYTIGAKDHLLRVGDLAFFYDVTNNMIPDSYLKSPSRITALLPDLLNIQEAQSAMNVNLKHSKKWLISTKVNYNNGAMDMRPDEKKEVEDSFHYKDVIATNADVATESLIVDFRKLMYDDIIASASLRVFSAYRITKDVLNWWKDGQTTYDNRGHGVVEFIQGSMKFEADDWGSTWVNYFGLEEEGLKLSLDFSEHHVMNLLEVKRSEGMERKSRIVKTLTDAGVPYEEALELSGLKDVV